MLLSKAALGGTPVRRSCMRRAWPAVPAAATAAFNAAQNSANRPTELNVNRVKVRIQLPISPIHCAKTAYACNDPGNLKIVFTKFLCASALIADSFSADIESREGAFHFLSLSDRARHLPVATCQ